MNTYLGCGKSTAKIEFTQHSIETPRGLHRYFTCKWIGPRTGLVEIDNQMIKVAQQRLPYRLKEVGQSDFGAYFVRTDAGPFVDVYQRLKAIALNSCAQLPIRLSWIAIMLGLATARHNHLGSLNPIDRWFWQRPKKDQSK